MHRGEEQGDRKGRLYYERSHFPDRVIVEATLAVALLPNLSVALLPNLSVALLPTTAVIHKPAPWSLNYWTRSPARRIMRFIWTRTFTGGANA
ncbi:MAG TPA: hypothetical protein VFQ36_12685 [Ktedonobacteraceae bacterium]|nr:hypothetical protein [Ktedonobacteraceae bacterium]